MAAKKKLTHSIKTAYGAFVCVFERERDMGGYTAEAIGIQGAISWGKNLAEAKKMIAEAIEGAIEGEAIITALKAGRISLRSPAKQIA